MTSATRDRFARRLSRQALRKPAGDPRDNIFDVLRLSFAVLVVFSHTYNLTNGSDVAEPFMRRSAHQVTGGAIAVDGFFVISGYLIACSWINSRSMASFLWRRFRRIYPGYAVAVVVSFAIAVVSAGSGASDYVHFVTGHVVEGISGAVLLTPRVLDNPLTFATNPVPHSVNAPLWTLAHEAYCYLAIVVMGLVGWLRPRPLLVIGGVVFSLYVVRLVLGVVPDPDGWRLHVFFVAGALCSVCRHRLPLGRTAPTLVSILVLMVGAVFPPLLLAALPVAGSYLLLTVAFNRHLRVLNTTAYGDVSYGVYLYGWPIGQALVLVTGTRQPLALFAAAAPLVCACALASWHLVERPTLRARHSIPSRLGIAPIGGSS